MRLQDRFWSKVRKTDNCWLWNASKVTSKSGLSYGEIWTGDRKQLAHRVSWKMANGSIPEGLTLDHLCRNTLCVRPDHLEVVSLKENILRGNGWAGRNARITHCPRGHVYAGNNIKPHLRGRSCRSCNNEWSRIWRITNRERINTYKREWGKSHRKQLNEYQRKWRTEQRVHSTQIQN